MSYELRRTAERRSTTIDDNLLQALRPAHGRGRADRRLEKKSDGLPILDPAREREKLADIVTKLPAGDGAVWLRPCTSMLFELSRSYQSCCSTPSPPPCGRTSSGPLPTRQPLFPPAATVACQGVEGAYSQLACEKLFKRPQVMYFKTFESVFSAIENGLLPLWRCCPWKTAPPAL